MRKKIDVPKYKYMYYIIIPFKPLKYPGISIVIKMKSINFTLNKLNDNFL